MLKINGVFHTGKVKETDKGTKYLTISNVNKDKKGNKTYTYYTLWLNEKASKLFSNDIKRKIAKDGAIVCIDGYLHVNINKTQNNNYTNLTIIPLEVKEFTKKQL